MADLILPDSRVEKPSLLTPRVKPYGGVKVDYDHPLSDKLCLFYLFHGIWAYECVNQKWVIDSSAVTHTQKFSPFGLGYSGHFSKYNNPFFKTTDNVFSLCASVYGNNLKFYQSGLDDFSASKVGNFNFAHNSTNKFKVYYSGNSSVLMDIQAADTPNGVWSSWVQSISAGTIDVFRDGVLMDSQAGGGSVDNLENTGTDNDIFVSRLNGVHHVYFMLYNKFLSQQDAKMIYENPYQMLIPQ